MSEALAGLYLHVPFCTRVCPYCDFAVRPDDGEKRKGEFVDAIVSGEAEANFKTRRVQATLGPRAKRPKMFSAPLPITVSGSFDDFNDGANAGDVVGTVIKFTASVVVVPFTWVFGKSMPEDGSDACRAAMAGDTAASADKKAK